MTTASRILAWLALLAVAGGACAHATLVLGEITVHPDPPRAGEPFVVSLTLVDPTMAPVEDAIVSLELRAQDETTAALPAAATVTPELPDAKVAVRLVETSPARYEAELTVARAATYHALVRDQTFAWEEANASLLLEVGGAPIGSLPFILPPTAVGPRSVWTWIAWLVGLPVAAGIVVTVLVLASGRGARDAARGRASGGDG